MIFIILLPYLGVFVYVIARGHKMQEHAAGGSEGPRPGDAAVRAERCAGSGSSADEIAKLADLRAQGVISEEEFQAAKAKALA